MIYTCIVGMKSMTKQKSKNGDVNMAMKKGQHIFGTVKVDIMKELAVKILKGLGNLSKGINDEE